MPKDKLFEFPLVPGLHGHVRINAAQVISIGMYERPTSVGSAWVVEVDVPGIGYMVTFPTHDEAHAFMETWAGYVNNT